MNNLAQIVINDGNGSQCMANYEHRVKCIRGAFNISGVITYATTWVLNANEWMLRNDKDYVTPSIKEILQASIEVAQYYEEHIREIEHV